MNKKFTDTFTKDELEYIKSIATGIGEDCIIIHRDEYYFELSADIGDALDIYCDENSNDTGKKLSKEEFLKLLKNSSPLS